MGGEQRLLFDLDADESETTDVAGANPAVVGRLDAALQAWEKGLAKPSWGAEQQWLDNQIKKHQPAITTREQERSLP